MDNMGVNSIDRNRALYKEYSDKVNDILNRRMGGTKRDPDPNASKEIKSEVFSHARSTVDTDVFDIVSNFRENNANPDRANTGGIITWIATKKSYWEEVGMTKEESKKNPLTYVARISADQTSRVAATIADKHYQYLYKKGELSEEEMKAAAIAKGKDFYDSTMNNLKDKEMGGFTLASIASADSEGEIRYELSGQRFRTKFNEGMDVGNRFGAFMARALGSTMTGKLGLLFWGEQHMAAILEASKDAARYRHQQDPNVFYKSPWTARFLGVDIGVEQMVGQAVSFLEMYLAGKVTAGLGGMAKNTKFLATARSKAALGSGIYSLANSALNDEVYRTGLAQRYLKTNDERDNHFSKWVASRVHDMATYGITMGITGPATQYLIENKALEFIRNTVGTNAPQMTNGAFKALYVAAVPLLNLSADSLTDSAIDILSFNAINKTFGGGVFTEGSEDSFLVEKFSDVPTKIATTAWKRGMMRLTNSLISKPFMNHIPIIGGKEDWTGISTKEGLGEVLDTFISDKPNLKSFLSSVGAVAYRYLPSNLDMMQKMYESTPLLRVGLSSTKGDAGALEGNFFNDLKAGRLESLFTSMMFAEAERTANAIYDMFTDGTAMGVIPDAYGVFSAYVGLGSASLNLDTKTFSLNLTNETPVEDAERIFKQLIDIPLRGIDESLLEYSREQFRKESYQMLTRDEGTKLAEAADHIVKQHAETFYKLLNSLGGAVPEHIAPTLKNVLNDPYRDGNQNSVAWINDSFQRQLKELGAKDIDPSLTPTQQQLKADFINNVANDEVLRKHIRMDISEGDYKTYDKTFELLKKVGERVLRRGGEAGEEQRKAFPFLYEFLYGNREDFVRSVYELWNAGGDIERSLYEARDSKGEALINQDSLITRALQRTTQSSVVLDYAKMVFDPDTGEIARILKDRSMSKQAKGQRISQLWSTVYQHNALAFKRLTTDQHDTMLDQYTKFKDASNGIYREALSAVEHFDVRVAEEVKRSSSIFENKMQKTLLQMGAGYAQNAFLSSIELGEPDSPQESMTNTRAFWAADKRDSASDSLRNMGLNATQKVDVYYMPEALVETRISGVDEGLFRLYTEGDIPTSNLTTSVDSTIEDINKTAGLIFLKAFSLANYGAVEEGRLINSKQLFPEGEDSESNRLREAAAERTQTYLNNAYSYDDLFNVEYNPGTGRYQMTLNIQPNDPDLPYGTLSKQTILLRARESERLPGKLTYGIIEGAASKSRIGRGEEERKSAAEIVDSIKEKSPLLYERAINFAVDSVGLLTLEEGFEHISERGIVDEAVKILDGFANFFFLTSEDKRAVAAELINRGYNQRRANTITFDGGRLRITPSHPSSLTIESDSFVKKVEVIPSTEQTVDDVINIMEKDFKIKVIKLTNFNAMYNELLVMSDLDYSDIKTEAGARRFVNVARKMTDSLVNNSPFAAYIDSSFQVEGTLYRHDERSLNSYFENVYRRYEGKISSKEDASRLLVDLMLAHTDYIDNERVRSLASLRSLDDVSFYEAPFEKLAEKYRKSADNVQPSPVDENVAPRIRAYAEEIEKSLKSMLKDLGVINVDEVASGEEPKTKGGDVAGEIFDVVKQVTTFLRGAIPAIKGAATNPQGLVDWIKTATPLVETYFNLSSKFKADTDTLKEQISGAFKRAEEKASEAYKIEMDNRQQKASEPNTITVRKPVTLSYMIRQLSEKNNVREYRRILETFDPRTDGDAVLRNFLLSHVTNGSIILDPGVKRLSINTLSSPEDRAARINSAANTLRGYGKGKLRIAIARAETIGGAELNDGEIFVNKRLADQIAVEKVAANNGFIMKGIINSFVPKQADTYPVGYNRYPSTLPGVFEMADIVITESALKALGPVVANILVENIVPGRSGIENVRTGTMTLSDTASVFLLSSLLEHAGTAPSYTDRNVMVAYSHNNKEYSQYIKEWVDSLPEGTPLFKVSSDPAESVASKSTLGDRGSQALRSTTPYMRLAGMRVTPHTTVSGSSDDLFQATDKKYRYNKSLDLSWVTVADLALLADKREGGSFFFTAGERKFLDNVLKNRQISSVEGGAEALGRKVMDFLSSERGGEIFSKYTVPIEKDGKKENVDFFLAMVTRFSPESGSHFTPSIVRGLVTPEIEERFYLSYEATRTNSGDHDGDQAALLPLKKRFYNMAAAPHLDLNNDKETLTEIVKRGLKYNEGKRSAFAPDLSSSNTILPVLAADDNTGAMAAALKNTVAKVGEAEWLVDYVVANKFSVNAISDQIRQVLKEEDLTVSSKLTDLLKPDKALSTRENDIVLLESTKGGVLKDFKFHGGLKSTGFPPVQFSWNNKRGRLFVVEDGNVTGNLQARGIIALETGEGLGYEVAYISKRVDSTLFSKAKNIKEALRNNKVLSEIFNSSNRDTLQIDSIGFGNRLFYNNPSKQGKLRITDLDGIANSFDSMLVDIKYGAGLGLSKYAPRKENDEIDLRALGSQAEELLFKANLSSRFDASIASDKGDADLWSESLTGLFNFIKDQVFSEKKDRRDGVQRKLEEAFKNIANVNGVVGDLYKEMSYDDGKPLSDISELYSIKGVNLFNNIIKGSVISDENAEFLYKNRGEIITLYKQNRGTPPGFAALAKTYAEIGAHAERLIPSLHDNITGWASVSDKTGSAFAALQKTYLHTLGGTIRTPNIQLYERIRGAFLGVSNILSKTYGIDFGVPYMKRISTNPALIPVSNNIRTTGELSSAIIDVINDTYGSNVVSHGITNDFVNKYLREEIGLEITTKTVPVYSYDETQDIARSPRYAGVLTETSSLGRSPDGSDADFAEMMYSIRDTKNKKDPDATLSIGELVRRLRIFPTEKLRVGTTTKDRFAMADQDKAIKINTALALLLSDEAASYMELAHYGLDNKGFTNSLNNINDFSVSHGGRKSRVYIKTTGALEAIQKALLNSTFIDPEKLGERLSNRTDLTGC